MKGFDLTDGVHGGIDPNTFHYVPIEDTRRFLETGRKMRTGEIQLPGILLKIFGPPPPPTKEDLRQPEERFPH